MVLSSYLLFSNKVEPYLKTFTSTLGRQILNEALDDLYIIQYYADNINKVFSYDLNDEEIYDMAYSFHVFEKTGKCIKCSYNNRSNDPPEYSGGEFEYTKFHPFNKKSVWQVAMDTTGSSDFPVATEFNAFAKEWIYNSETLKKIRQINVLGYDAEGNFGLNKTIRPGHDDITDTTIRVFENLLKYAASPDIYEGTHTRVGYVIAEVQKKLSVPEDTKIVFGSTYNRLNQNRENAESTQAVLYDKWKQIMEDIPTSVFPALQRQKAIYDDCRIIFDARFKNIAFNSELYKDSESFRQNLPESFIVSHGEPDAEVTQLITDLYDMAKKSAIVMPRSTMAVLELHYLLQEVDLFLNDKSSVTDNPLSIVESSEEFILVSKQLYDYFSIPFYFGDAKSDLMMLIKNSYGIAEEEDRFDKPQEDLVLFACVLARSVQSKIGRVIAEEG